MAIQKPRTRLVNIRLSDEEFLGLRRSTDELNARSISDFCRQAILSASMSSGQSGLDAIERRLEQMEVKVAKLADRFLPPLC